MARSIIQGTLAFLLILVFIYDCKDSGGVQADQLKELEKAEEWNLPSEIEQPKWRIVREAGKKIGNGSKNKKTEKGRKNKKNKKNSGKTNKKIRQVKPNKRKSKNKAKRKKNKARRNKKKLRRNKKRSRKNRKMLRQRKDKSKKIKNKAKQHKKEIGKGRRKSTHQKKKIGKGRRKSTHQKKKTNIIHRMETKQTCNEKELEGKIKLYIRISNQLRKAKRITKFCDLMERKAEKSLTTFNETVAALNKSLKCLESSSGRRTYLSRFNWRRFSRSIRDDTCLLELTGERDILENCRKTAYAKCETSSVEGCQNATHRTECEKKLQDWLNKFGPAKGSCLQASDNYCSCITALPDVPTDCLLFDKPEKSVKAAKNKCTRSDEEGSFGFCKKLQLEAAILISKCETCTSGVDNCTQSTSTPGVVTTTRKHTTSSSGGGCGCITGCETTNKWLVVTGGDNNLLATNDGRLDSSEIISSTGVCKPIPSPTIPPLPVATSAGEMVFMGDCNKGKLIFCGGSTRFIDHTHPIDNWGATNLCYSLPTGAPNAWSTTGGFAGMLKERSWFSLTKIDENTMIAVGGIDNSGVATPTMEQYSSLTKRWTFLSKNLTTQRFGHCTVPYHTGGRSYLIVIGGSTHVAAGSSWKAVNTVYEVDVAASTTREITNLPEPLFRPACTISCENDIFVSGGAVGDGHSPPAGTKVYKYTFNTGTWSTVGDLNTKRWGHVMGNVGASANRKMSVAGGYTQTNFLTSVEDSINGGVTWTGRRTNLLVEREYAASAEVPANTFSCQG